MAVLLARRGEGGKSLSSQLVTFRSFSSTTDSDRYIAVIYYIGMEARPDTRQQAAEAVLFEDGFRGGKLLFF